MANSIILDAHGITFPEMARKTGLPFLPYPINASFPLQRHEAPSPFGSYYKNEPDIIVRGLENKTQLDWCVEHPPMPGVCHPSSTRPLQFARPIRTDPNCGAQIMLTTDNLIAKIYDPLFYKFEEEDEYSRDDHWINIDVSACADSDYSVEAAAYAELQNTELAGDIIPRYHGSWTFDAELELNGKSITRPVRMILLEYIEGPCMAGIDPSTLSEKARDNVMVKVMEASCEIHYAGVLHHDNGPRNVVLSSEDLESTDLRVCIIDFNVSRVWRLCGMTGPDPRQRNPITLWAGNSNTWSIPGWLPWDRAATDWIWRQWGDSPKYAHLEKDPDDCAGRAKLPPLSDEELEMLKRGS